jgi:hypothetical protein
VSVQVRLISEFVSYGTTSLLEDNLLEIIQPDLPWALTALEVSLQLHAYNWDLSLSFSSSVIAKTISIFDGFEE